MKPAVEPGAPVAEAADEAFIARLGELVSLVGSASALARRAGISHSGLSRYMAGGDPSRRVLTALAQAAEVSLAWLASGVGPMRPPSAPALPTSTLRLVPYLAETEGTSSRDEVGPSTRKDFTAQAFCFRWLNDNGLDDTRLSALEVRGESMAPTLRPGNIVLIDTDAREIEDDRLYLLRDDSHLLIRRLQLEIGGTVRALADNPVHREFVAPRDSLKLLGRVVWCGALL
ncbi:helix-turn-helix transcriptional regulator [Variovorax sp. J22G40]|uniref:XRE family transcriptional regulator n=1 Tax=Variovorax sp. J22G40 TaxID=3053505 RepID=UPI0025773284|nr:helix-turn-helix transcriptional regulator [Variovorax sp. J22G40]